MKIQNTNNTIFGAKFLDSQSLYEVAKYAKENGKFDKLNTARKNINRAYLNRRISFELFVTADDKKIPYVILTRYTPKKNVTIPKTSDDCTMSEPFIFISKKKMNPYQFGYELIKAMGNNAPQNNLYQQVVAGKNITAKPKSFYQII